jgi:TusA-related sulfurtransferase
MPKHLYIFAPTGEMWPAASINARLPKIPVVKKNGVQAVDSNGKPRSMSPSVWLDRHRAVEQMTWAPGEPQTIVGRLVSDGGWIEREGVATFNLYRPPVVRPGNAANAGRWVGLVQLIYPDNATHIIAFLAHRIQRPAEKINHALVLTGPPGIGKDTLLEPLKLGVGPWNFREVSPTDITSPYNDFMRSVVLRVSEARDLGDINRYAFYESTKTIMAAPPDVTRVNGKYIPQHYVVNVTGVILTTNYPQDGLYLPPDDRRHYVAGTEVTKDDFEEGFWPAIWAWYGADGLEDVVAYLSTYDLSGFDPKKPPEKTEAFWRMVDGGMAPEVAELRDVLDRLGKIDATGKPCPPVVVTIAQVMEALRTGGDLYAWFSDRKNRRTIPHRFESCGYVPVRNSDREDGLWVIAGRRQVVYGRKGVAPAERLAAAQVLKAAEDLKAAELKKLGLG